MFQAPFQVDFDITLQCVFSCRHCNVDAGERLPDEMSTDQIKGVLDQLFYAGVCDLSITGGEPLLRRDVREMSFETIWNGSPVFAALRAVRLAELDGHCPDCRLGGLCGGGCRLRAFVRANAVGGEASGGLAAIAPAAAGGAGGDPWRAVDYLCPLHAEARPATAGR